MDKIIKELANIFDTILKSDMCHEEQLETLLQETRQQFSNLHERVVKPTLAEDIMSLITEYRDIQRNTISNNLYDLFNEIESKCSL